MQSVSEMTRKTVKRADLCNAVYHKTGLSRAESETQVELVLKEIAECLERGETVKLSSFGSFVVRNKRQRIGRNPKTGKGVVISPRRVMVFKPSESLKQRINIGCASLTNVPQEVLATALGGNVGKSLVLTRRAAKQHT